jgi:predicted ATPase
VLIGPNKSGKSSILDALKFMCEAMTFADIAKPLDTRGGFFNVLWKGKATLGEALAARSESIEFDLIGAIDDAEGERMECSYSVTVSGDMTGSVFLGGETLDVSFGGRVYRLIEMKNGVGVAKKVNGTELFENPQSRTRPVLSYDIPGWEAERVKRDIVQWHFFDLIPQLAKVTSNSAAAVTSLDVHGASLSSWIHTLQVNHPEEFQRIVKVVSDAFPEIESLGSVVTQAGTVFLALREKHLQSPVFPVGASSGELKFLILMSLIYSPMGTSLVAVEEPENHLHPRLLSLLVEIANQRRIELEGRVAQAVVTTHSPYLVDLLEPEDIVVVDKRDGATECKRPGSGDELRRLLREAETTLGRLWFSGSLGGV